MSDNSTRTQSPIRVVVGKVGLDGHEVGARIVARGLRDAGMEVIYTGIRRTPEQIVMTALQEDCDVIGLSILSGAHVPLVGRVRALLHDHDLDDVLTLVGGVIPEADVDVLRKMGVDAVFHPATTIEEIVSFIDENVRGTASAQSAEER